MVKIYIATLFAITTAQVLCMNKPNPATPANTPLPHAEPDGSKTAPTSPKDFPTQNFSNSIESMDHAAQVENNNADNEIALQQVILILSPRKSVDKNTDKKTNKNTDEKK